VAAKVQPGQAGFTIDELARRTGTTTRTLRLYQTKSLMPPPRIVGRVGYYSEVHVNRLVMIDRLQRRGFSLAGIGELFKVWQQGKSLDELLGIEAALVAPWNEEEPEFVAHDDFVARFGKLTEDPELRERAIRLGLIQPEGEGYWLQSPLLLTFGQELVARGVPLDVAFSELELLREDARRMAKRFTKMFRRHVLPRVVTGAPGEWLPRLAEDAKRMRPAVRGLVLSSFSRAMDEEIAGYRLANVQSEVAEASLEETEETPEEDARATGEQAAVDEPRD
jgi:DNA-binding transcriptional MerR regulator